MPRDHQLYLDDILDAIERIQHYTKGLDETGFGMDTKTQDVVIRNLQVICEAARLLPENVRNQAMDIEWRKIAGMRNILIHEYFGISSVIIWDIITSSIGSTFENVSRCSYRDSSNRFRTLNGAGWKPALQNCSY